MWRTVKEALEKRAKLITDAREVHGKITPETGEGEARDLKSKFDAIMAEVRQIDAFVDRERSLGEIEARAQDGDNRRPLGENTETRGHHDPAGVTYRGAFNDFLRAAGNLQALAPEARAMLARGETAVEGAAPEGRAQSVGTDTAGGFLVPQEMLSALVVAMTPFAPMVADDLTQTFTTPNGREVPIPGLDDTANDAAALAENADMGNAADVVFQKKTLGAYLMATGWLRYSLALAQDGAFGMEPLLAQLLGERMGRRANKWLTNGTGVNQPLGVVPAATASAVVPAGASAVTADELLAFVNSVPAHYRMSPRSRLQFNDNTFGALVMLKDGQGNYLIKEAPDRAGVLQIGARRVPYSINPDMQDMGAGAASMVYGDMSRFVVRKVGLPVIGALHADRTFWPDFGIAGYWRIDSALMPASAGAIKKLVHPAG